MGVIMKSQVISKMTLIHTQLELSNFVELAISYYRIEL